MNALLLGQDKTMSVIWTFFIGTRQINMCYMNALLLGQDKTCVLNERFLLIGTRQSNLCYMNAFKKLGQDKSICIIWTLFKNWDKTKQYLLYERFKKKIGTGQSNVCYMNTFLLGQDKAMCVIWTLFYWDKTKQCVLYERFLLGQDKNNVCYMNAFFFLNGRRQFRSQPKVSATTKFKYVRHSDLNVKPKLLKTYDTSISQLHQEFIKVSDSSDNFCSANQN